MKMKLVTSTQFATSELSFWQCINILTNKFNVINKRLWGCKVLFHCFCKPIDLKWSLPYKCSKLSNYNSVHTDLDIYKCLLHKELKLLDTGENGEGCIETMIVELLPKNFSENKAYQLAVLDKHRNSATFFDITPDSYSHNLCPNFTYSLTYRNNEVFLETDTDTTCKSYAWLAETVLPQFIKWGDAGKKQKQICKESLSLISKDKYYEKYNELKIKYGKEMVKIWPEVTDPYKFVYEDVAIATYLLLLWELEDNNQVTRKSFVDLGCGNGLLVYILTKEGHRGLGIDVRKRQIWEIFPPEIKLEERTIVPSDSNLFPEADWLIGNHSDELTPWIPVIAARSSYKCKFFLLPCCAYNFDGSKYQRKDSSKSQYTEYLEYIKEVCVTCGFETKLDRLKIPSTKRICLVGGKKVHPEEENTEYYDKIHSFINESSPTSKDTSSNWVADFKPREQFEKVRNCTQVEKYIIESIVKNITEFLLNGCHLESRWSRGKEVDLSELVLLLSDKDLKALKAECGGLQTLLKNNHHIFKVQKGKVQITYPRTVEEVNKTCYKGSKNNLQIKQKPCWFFEHHPQGCPLTDVNCSYLHGKVT